MMPPSVLTAIIGLLNAIDEGASWSPTDAQALADALERIALMARWRGDANLLGPQSAFAQRMEEHSAVSPTLRARLWLSELPPDEAAAVRRALRLEPFPEEQG